MAGAKFQYDESGGTFFYFLLSFLALVVIPCTYYFWPKDERAADDKKGSGGRRSCRCPQCLDKTRRLRVNQPWRRTKQNIVRVLLVLGWVAMAATAYKVAHLEHDFVKWDPYEILEIDPSSSERAIRKAYHKLSLVYHPDKDTGDEQKFMMIAKAYAALTDEEARKNWETYGNPDGPGATSFGIALPSWIVEKENSLWVLGLYAAVFMIALPVAVGVWWYRSAKYGEDQVLLDTSHLYLYFINKCHMLILRRVIMVLAASLEFEKSHNPEIVLRPTDDVEIPALIKMLPNFNEKNRERPLCYEYSIKARALLYAHMLRIPLSPGLDEDRCYVLRKCPALLAEFVHCASQLTMLGLAGRISRIPSLETLESAMRLSALLVQAQWEHSHPFLQLPHVTEELLKHLSGKRRSIRSLHQLCALPAADRRALFRNLSDAQYEDILTCLENLPLIVLSVSTEVLDDEDEGVITAESIVTVTATLTRRPLLSNAKEEATQPEAEDASGAEEAEAAAGDLKDNSPQVRSTANNKHKGWDKSRKKKGAKGGKGKKKNATQNKGKKQQAVVTETTKEEAHPQPARDEEQHEAGDVDEDSYSDDSDDERHSEKHASRRNSAANRNSSAAAAEEDDDWQSIQHKVSKKDKNLEKKSRRSHSVHCPLFPDDKQEFWWVYLVDKKQRSLSTVPFLVTNLVDSEEVVLKFTAPSRPGIYHYTLHVRSDSYRDLDVMHNLRLDVKPAQKVQETHPQWDISEDEEDRADEEDSAVEDSDLAASEGSDDD
ncbi:translocation protein SEC63 homolog [Dermacentor albipictus]|uniref:translocation protein SEC63 homolog n=1 Tax=Dermacentor albipictus TaxID=60249 RepID=UPI0031FDC793